jgi:hypothetical protein
LGSQRETSVIEEIITYKGDPVLLRKPGCVVMQVALGHKWRHQADPLGFVNKDAIELEDIWM